MREYFMETERTGFSKWKETDIKLAKLLWGSPEVTHYICASGRFTLKEIEKRLQTEIKNDASYGVQYWAVFDRESQELIGCCGLRPFEKEENTFEIGFHLRKKYWGQGFAEEAAKAVIEYAFSTLGAKKLVAGHHPENHASGKLLGKLGFSYIGDNYYEPTGLMHPSYVLFNHVEQILLEFVTQRQKGTLWNLLQKYLYEFSIYYGDAPGPDGNYDYEYFECYFTEEKREAYLIKRQKDLIGFFMINNHSETGEAVDYVMAEFCILPIYRKKHYGAEAVNQIFHSHRGKWQVKYTRENAGAMNFWQKVTERFERRTVRLNKQDEVIIFEVR